MPLWSLAHSVSASLILSMSSPDLKPSKKLLPMVAPSATAPEASNPKRAKRPAVIPLPRVSPKAATFSVSHGLPVLSHHWENGSATILSQAMAIFPQTSALAHSSLLVNSAMVPLSWAIFSSTTSMTRLMALSTSGIFDVSQSTNSRKYGDNLDPNAIFTPSTADDR